LGNFSSTDEVFFLVLGDAGRGQNAAVGLHVAACSIMVEHLKRRQAYRRKSERTQLASI
jgi:hypothetical protein